MSANEHPDTVFECIRAGAEDYLLKPLTKKEVQYIWQHVWRRKHQPALRVPPQPVQEPAQDQVGCLSFEAALCLQLNKQLIRSMVI